jgi:hypothetical protein
MIPKDSEKEGKREKKGEEKIPPVEAPMGAPPLKPQDATDVIAKRAFALWSPGVV